MNHLKKEIVLSTIFRAVSIISGIIIAGVLVRELGASKYGVWATLTSLLAWMQLSDFGVGNVLKNKIASARKEENNFPLVIGVFQFYFLVAIFLAIFFFLLGNNLEIVEKYHQEAALLYLGFIISFPLSVGSGILQGLHKNSIVAMLSCLQSLIWLVAVLIIVWLGPSLFLLSAFNVFVLVIIGIMQCLFAYKLLPVVGFSIMSHLFDYRKILLALPLWRVGSKFLILQISNVLFFSLGTYLTYINLTSSDAARYDLLFKIFQIPIIFFGLVISVFWIEISKLNACCDFDMLAKRFYQLHLIGAVIILSCLVFVIFMAVPLMSLYSSNRITTTVYEAAAFWLSASIQIFAYSGAVFLNAAEKLQGQLFIAIIAALLLVPVSIYFYSIGVGFVTVPLVTSILLLPSLIYCNWTAFYEIIKKNN